MDSKTRLVQSGMLPGAVIAFFEAHYERYENAGGYCAVVIEPGKPRVIAEGAKGGSAERHGLKAFAAVLRATPADQPLIIGNANNSDATKPFRVGWLPKWAERGWKLKDGRSVPDVDLWREIAGLVEGRVVFLCYSAIHHRLRLDPRPWDIALKQLGRAHRGENASTEIEPIAVQAKLLSAYEAHPLPSRETGGFTVVSSGCVKGAGAGPGGYAALILSDGSRETVRGREAETTSSRMQMTAIAEALATLPLGSTVTVHTGDEFVAKAFNDGWLRTWKRNDWVKKSDRKEPLNLDLWKRLDVLSGDHSVTWKFGGADLGSLPLGERPQHAAAEEMELAVSETGWVPGTNHGFKDETALPLKRSRAESAAARKTGAARAG